MRRFAKLPAAVAGVAIGLMLAIVWLTSAPQSPPSFDQVKARWRPSDAQLLDRDGDSLYERRIDSYGRRLAWTPIDEISPALQQTVIASEDRRFYHHHGVDLRAVAAAVTAPHRRSGHARGAGHDYYAAHWRCLTRRSAGRGHRRSLAQKIRQRSPRKLSRSSGYGREAPDFRGPILTWSPDCLASSKELAPRLALCSPKRRME